MELNNLLTGNSVVIGNTDRAENTLVIKTAASLFRHFSITASALNSKYIHLGIVHNDFCKVDASIFSISNTVAELYDNKNSSLCIYFVVHSFL